MRVIHQPDSSTNTMGRAASPEPHGETCGRPLDPMDGLNPLGNTVSQAIEVVRLELNNDVERPGHGIDRDNPSIFMRQLLHRLSDGLGVADLSLDEHVAPNCHAVPPTPAELCPS